MGGGAAAVSLLMLLTPVAAGVRPLATILPPYTGATVSPSTSWSYSGCGTSKIISYAKWSPTSGAGIFGGSTSAKSTCRALGSVGGGGYAYVSGGWSIQIPITVPAGTTSVQPNWTLAFTAAEKQVVVKSCPTFVPAASGYSYQSCNAYSSIDVYFDMYLYDKTSGYYIGSSYYSVYNSSSQYNDTNCYSGSCSYYNNSYGSPASLSVNMPFVGYMNTTYNSSHTYVLNAYLYASADANAFGYRSAIATAVVALHNGATLTRLNSIGVF